MLSCDNIALMRYSSVLVHTASFGIGGKLGDIQAIADFTSKHNKKMLTEVYKGFLTDEEIKDIIKGVDLWITKEECEERLQKWTPLRARDLPKKDECIEEKDKVKEVKPTKGNRRK